MANVGGEVEFDDSYEHNTLVNAMCVGLLPAEKLTRAKATGPGNLVVLYGSKTGRDGIGGASVLASQGFDESSADKRPSVQIGDPFTGKKLIECTLDLLDRGLLASLQDLGAAGLASSLSEMAASGGVGHRRRPVGGAAARGGHGAVRDHDLRVAGADGGRGRAGAGWRTCWPSARAGIWTRR